MFVKGGESLISGLADRFFRAIEVLIPPGTSKQATTAVRVFSLSLPGTNTGLNQVQLDSVVKAVCQLGGIVDHRVAVGPPSQIRVQVGSDGPTSAQIIQATRLEGFVAEEITP
jgi:hypothetical protein